MLKRTYIDAVAVMIRFSIIKFNTVRKRSDPNRKLKVCPIALQFYHYITTTTSGIPTYTATHVILNQYEIS